MGCVQSKKGSVDITGDRGREEPGTLGRPTIPRQDYYDKHSGTRTDSRNKAEPPAAPKVEEAKTQEEKEVLKVVDVNFNVAENVSAHRTERYEITEEREEEGKTLPAQLVVRRGQPFNITLKFDRAFDKDKDDINLIFTVGAKPKESRGTEVVMMLSDTDKPRQWGAKIKRMHDCELDITIFTPPNCIVAKWNFKCDTVLKKDDNEKVFRYTHNNYVYLLFNPWCPDDEVYMDDETARQEYVLHDQGRIYRGTQKQLSAKPWNYGQFEDFMLDCVFFLMDKCYLTYRVRGNPVEVVRKISAMTNAPDDGGVLVGNWSGDYSGGTSPLAWVGSVAILEEYWKTKKPVKFGQCWVFSGVVTSIARCLGIPCRSVTNFASAHDVDGSITIDVHWDKEGLPLEAFNDDSIWNFHVWNDVWMARQDLPPGFGGWQAIDATPQETSNGVYCAGPASLEALKNGLVHLPFDGPFIFAEVNADRVHWIQKPENLGWINTKENHSIGKMISTKSLNSNNRMDVTNSYKFPEGTQQERTAVWRAIKQGSTRKEIYEVEIEDMKFDLHERDDVVIGQPFDVTLKVANSSVEERQVKATLTATVIFYTGVPGKVVKTESYTINTNPKAEGHVAMTVKPEDYLDKLVDMAIMKISCMVQVVETKQIHCECDNFRLLKPRLNIKVPTAVTVGEEYEVEVAFTNPLPRALTRCEFELEGAGLQKPMKIKHTTVGPHAEAKVTTTMVAKHAGEKELIAGFDSKELMDCTGTATYKVNPKK